MHSYTITQEHTTITDFFSQQRKGLLVWGWLIKPFVVMILNLYFVIVWMIRRGRYYHSYDTPEEVEQELLFIYFGAATAGLQVLLTVWFCCSSGVFTYHVSLPMITNWSLKSEILCCVLVSVVQHLVFSLVFSIYNLLKGLEVTFCRSLL